MAIIGLLAAIGLPTFLGQVDQGRDAAAKSDAAMVASMADRCAVESTDYRRCDTESEVAGAPGASGLDWGPGRGQVEVATATEGTYRVVARSRSGNEFTVFRNSSGTALRTCTTGGDGGCPAGEVW
jgi:type II secretory pathway pseudopilin PulG